MSDHTRHCGGSPPEPGFWRSRTGLISMVLGVVAVLYLLLEHTGYVIQWLPFGILLLCPLMHVVMHGNHSEHGGGSSRSGSRS